MTKWCLKLVMATATVWFGRQVAVCVQKRHKNGIFGCSWFLKFNFDCFLLKLLICSPKMKTYSKLCVLC